MTTLRRFCCDDLFRINNINMDHMTETYNMVFYQHYMAKWPEYFEMAVHPSGRNMGYVIGKVEGKGRDWHGHVTAVTVAPEFRRIQLARKLMGFLEFVSETIYNAYFVDLYVRISNAVAIEMYKNMNYGVYREIIGYYSGGENAYDMRKSLARDPKKELMARKVFVPVDPDPNWD